MDNSEPSADLFFAGSDDDEDVMMEEPQSETSLSKGPKTALFLPDSEDENESHASAFTTPQKRPVHTINDDTDSEIEIPGFEEEPRASSVGSMSSVPGSPMARASSPTPSIEIVDRPKKKRRVSISASMADELQILFKPIYLGSFVGNAWSTVRGKGYVKAGDQILVEREDQEDAPSFKEAQSKNKKGKTLGKGKTKQLSIATMMNVPQPRVSKKKVNTIVRLTNSRGFGLFYTNNARKRKTDLFQNSVDYQPT